MPLFPQIANTFVSVKIRAITSERAMILFFNFQKKQPNQQLIYTKPKND
jgi:hypothetical protein